MAKAKYEGLVLKLLRKRCSPLLVHIVGKKHGCSKVEGTIHSLFNGSFLATGKEKAMISHGLKVDVLGIL